jgi:hypothetical protein
MTDKQRITEILKAYTKKHNISASSVILEEYAEELIANGVTSKKRGEWVYCENGGYICSNCTCWMEDYYSATPKMMRYCFNCGAKMKDRKID